MLRYRDTTFPPQEKAGQLDTYRTRTEKEHSIRVSLGVPPQEGVLRVSDPLHLFKIILLIWADELDMHPADEFRNLNCVGDGIPVYRKS